ncbi:hypothetical protein J6590_017048, partial [Homalodisca vitripennis]
MSHRHQIKAPTSALPRLCRTCPVIGVIYKSSFKDSPSRAWFFNTLAVKRKDALEQS